MDEAALCLPVSANDGVMIINHNVHNSVIISKTNEVYDATETFRETDHRSQDHKANHHADDSDKCYHNSL